MQTISGKLPIEVDMTSMNNQEEVHQFSPPPPIPPHRDEDNEDTGSEVELVTVTSEMSGQRLKLESEYLATAMDEPPSIPEKINIPQGNVKKI